MEYKRGDVFFANLGEGVGSEQIGTRPVVIIQNNIGNRYSPTVVVACITSKIYKTPIPTHVNIRMNGGENLVLCEQIKTIDKTRLLDRITTLGYTDIERVNRALRQSLEV